MVFCFNCLFYHAFLCVNYICTKVHHVHVVVYIYKSLCSKEYQTALVIQYHGVVQPL